MYGSEEGVTLLSQVWLLEARQKNERMPLADWRFRPLSEDSQKSAFCGKKATHRQQRSALGRSYPKISADGTSYGPKSNREMVLNFTELQLEDLRELFKKYGRPSDRWAVARCRNCGSRASRGTSSWRHSLATVVRCAGYGPTPNMNSRRTPEVMSRTAIVLFAVTDDPDRGLLVLRLLLVRERGRPVLSIRFVDIGDDLGMTSGLKIALTDLAGSAFTSSRTIVLQGSGPFRSVLTIGQL